MRKVNIKSSQNHALADHHSCSIDDLHCSTGDIFYGWLLLPAARAKVFV
jgi:hypothetical protein